MSGGKLGIEIVTFNRRELLMETISSVKKHTKRDDVDLIVADDGSTDGTLDMLGKHGVPAVTGANMGIAWNKNRALYLLAQVQRCEVVILLEDDTQPTRDGWEADWVDAIRRWGHINFAGDWIQHGKVYGCGTAEDPVMSRLTSAQCAGYSRESLDYGGYYDSRFRGYGHEHVEHSRRMIRVGYGGTDKQIDGNPRVLFALLVSPLTVHKPPSYHNAEQVAQNLAVARQAMADHTYRAPWRTIDEMDQFRSEIKQAVANNPDGFEMRRSRSAEIAERTVCHSRTAGGDYPRDATATMPETVQSEVRAWHKHLSWFKRR